MAELQGRTDERQDLALAGKATNRGFRAQENYNSIFNTQPGRQSINPRTSAIVDPPDGRLPPWTMEQAKLWDEREAVMVGRGEAASAQDVIAAGVVSPPWVPRRWAPGAWDLAGKNLAMVDATRTVRICFSPTGMASPAPRVAAATGFCRFRGGS